MSLSHSPPLLLVRSSEAARMLSISERTLWALAASGEIPRMKVRRSVHFYVDDLRAFMDRKV
jgi:excisionase family DNA binding protein